MGMRAAAVFVILVAVRAVYGADIRVGDASGWDQGVDYSAWAAKQTFRVGDSLVFNYGVSHSVDEVSEANYKACSSGSVIGSHTGGATSIPLSAPGSRYFICPTAGHCGGGMKLQVNVLAANSTPGGTPTPNPPASTPPPPPPSPSAASRAFCGLKHLIFGASLACLATLFVL